MAIRPNEDLENRHTLFIGQSGSGKTYYLKNHPWLKGRKRVVVWDPYESHKSHYFRSVPAFGQALKSAVNHKSFRIGLAIHPDPAAFEQFCRMVWAIADGSKGPLYVVVEELGDVSKPGKAGQNWGQLVRVGRKYNIVLMPVTQRPQEIDKTLFTQVSRIWCGLVSGYDRAYVEKHLGLDRGSLADIVPKSYRFVYVKGPAVQWGGPGRKVEI